MSKQDQLQPHNIDAEEAVLGALLIDQDAILAISSSLTPNDFFIGKNGWIYEAILAVHRRNQPVDLVVVQDELEQRGRLDGVGSAPALTELSINTPTSMHIAHYAGIVKRTSNLRKLISGAAEITKLAYGNEAEADEILDQAEQLIFSIGSEQTKRDLRAIGDAMPEFHDIIARRSEHQDALVGVSTGLKDLDRLLGGLQKSDLVILAGRPAMGKTSLGISTALHAAQRCGKRVAVFSLEMSEEQILARLVAAYSGLNSQKVRLGRFNEDEWPIFNQATAMLENAPIFVDDTPAISAMELRSKARRLDAEYGIDLVIVDYLQLMMIGGDVSSKSDNRQQEISKISGSLKQLARELNVPVLALSQLSRACESRSDKRPMLSDLRDSGSIEQDADVVMFVYRDEVYNPDTEFPNVAEIIVSKHRNGPTGMFSVYFKKALAQFVDLDIRVEPLSYA